jgi:DNA-binding NtrC family response regulator
LEEGAIWRVGGTSPIGVNVRFVFSSNRPLKKEVEKGVFREDLYFRISTFTICLPLLKERGEDIFMLARYFLKRASASFGKRVLDLSDDALDFLTEYEFPGNVRELKNMVERAVVLADGTLITSEQLAGRTMGREVRTNILNIKRLRGRKLKEVLESVEGAYIEDTLLSNDFNISKTAQVLGISRPALYFMMRKHGIRKR